MADVAIATAAAAIAITVFFPFSLIAGAEGDTSGRGRTAPPDRARDQSQDQAEHGD
jgi:hypothetical protein